jgi:hypothetical protein
MFKNNLVMFAVSASLGFAPLFAANEPAYNPASMVEVVGTIATVRQVPAGSPFEGVHLTLKTKTSTLDAYLAPGDFLRIFKTDFRVGAVVRIVGSKVKVGDADVILTTELNIAATSIILRDGSGVPFWQNWGVAITG